MDTLIYLAFGLVGFVLLLAAAYKAMGIVVVGDAEVGIVTKKISRKNLPPGQVIAQNGEAGIQA